MTRNRKRKSTSNSKTSKPTTEKKSRENLSIDSQEKDNSKTFNNKNTTENEDIDLSLIPASGDKVPNQEHEIQARQRSTGSEQKGVTNIVKDEEEKNSQGNDEKDEEKKEMQVKQAQTKCDGELLEVIPNDCHTGDNNFYCNNLYCFFIAWNYYSTNFKNRLKTLVL